MVTSSGRARRRLAVVAGACLLLLGLVSGPAPADPAEAVPALAPDLLAALERDLGLSPTQARARVAADLAAARRNAAASQEAAATGSLADTMRRLDRTPAPAAVIAWYADAAADRVVIEAASKTTAAAFVARSGADPKTIHIVRSTIRPVPQIALYGGTGWGTGISASCSVGFSVSRIAAPSVRGYVTAGHCGSAGQTAYANADGAWIPQGTVRGATFPVRDYAWVEITDDWTPRPHARRNSTLQIIQGWQPAGIDAIVCRSGISTGWRCGEITATNVTVNFPQGTVTGLTRTDACAASGDSGGPYLVGWHAQGVHVASSGSCSSGGTTYFQPLVPILDAYDLRLMTAGAGSTPPIIRNMHCGYEGNFTTRCIVTQYHPDPVTVRWTVNGVPRAVWNDDLVVTGPCGQGLNTVRVTISNGSGSATASRSVRCTGEAP